MTKRSMVLGCLPFYGEAEVSPDRSQASSLSAEELVVAYHKRTKHHFHRFAAPVGYMDWATPFKAFRSSARPLSKGNSVAIYGPEGSRGSLHDVLAGQMEFTYFPIELNQLPAAITYHDLTEGIHTIGGARVPTGWPERDD